ncbi:hypothetical protein ES708_19059 [subsurface metagenome]
MNITGLEVIRRNPGVAVANPGIAVGVIVGERIELTYGETLRVNTSFDYRGLAQKVTLYGAIGTSGIYGFDEILVGEAEVDLPDSPEFTPCTASVDIGIISDISPIADIPTYKVVETPGVRSVLRVNSQDIRICGLNEIPQLVPLAGIPNRHKVLSVLVVNPLPQGAGAPQGYKPYGKRNSREAGTDHRYDILKGSIPFPSGCQGCS